MFKMCLFCGSLVPTELYSLNGLFIMDVLKFGRGVMPNVDIGIWCMQLIQYSMCCKHQLQ